ncbi:hypothetical protein E2562_035064, partial [Oryza meyeriana var. granulata]
EKDQNRNSNLARLLLPLASRLPTLLPSSSTLPRNHSAPAPSSSASWRRCPLPPLSLTESTSEETGEARPGGWQCDGGDRLGGWQRDEGDRPGGWQRDGGDRPGGWGDG